MAKFEIGIFTPKENWKGERIRVSLWKFFAFFYTEVRKEFDTTSKHIRIGKAEQWHFPILGSVIVFYIWGRRLKRS